MEKENTSDPKKTITPSGYTEEGVKDEFGDKRIPPENFIYPEKGMKVKALVNYNTASGKVIPAGAIGEVVGIRKPGLFANEPGYIGCVVFFEVGLFSYKKVLFKI